MLFSTVCLGENWLWVNQFHGFKIPNYAFWGEQQCNEVAHCLGNLVTFIDGFIMLWNDDPPYPKDS